MKIGIVGVEKVTSHSKKNHVIFLSFFVDQVNLISKIVPLDRLRQKKDNISEIYIADVPYA